ncbi:hypothetical protein JQ607_02845 [Bradyrhizobium liaoningense]|uniref:hypothetical protein n=1 Tax=Bradyrhizobium liaoningense TaxID=43992 RepID=UPI001BAB981C|nr:hypothetical protein [Bradyrhizobium liaoningense]MBR0839121.1 hypothetical protein [Bradyrhizobium liaoningense]
MDLSIRHSRSLMREEFELACERALSDDNVDEVGEYTVLKSFFARWADFFEIAEFLAGRDDAVDGAKAIMSRRE